MRQSKLFFFSLTIPLTVAYFCIILIRATYISKNFCRPFILWITSSVFLRLKNGFQGGNLGNSLHKRINKSHWTENHAKSLESGRINCTGLPIKQYKGDENLHDQRILLQAVSQPNKLTVSSPHSWDLLSKAHAVGLQREWFCYQIQTTQTKPWRKFRGFFSPPFRNGTCM